MSISRILIDLCVIRPKTRIENTFADIVFNVLAVEKSCKNKKVYLKINGKQRVKLRSNSIKFKNYFKQWAVLFKIDADFESDF